MSARKANPQATDDRQYRIGEIAERAGTTTRALRYYEELGLVSPSGYSPGGARRYVQADLDRVLRVRELQALMGFNLDEIRGIMSAEDRLEELRSEYRRGVSAKRLAAILQEGSVLNARTLEKVLSKLILLETFQAELETKAERYRELAAEHGVTLHPDDA